MKFTCLSKGGGYHFPPCHILEINGLPFLTRTKGFSAKIYVTEVSARLGLLMMEDLVSTHMEMMQLLGPQESSLPQWMKWEELKLLPSSLRHVALGKDGGELGELGSWMPVYSAADVKDCMLKVQKLKYAEEACYNCTLIIKPFSSGLEIGTCNWTINSSKGGVAFITRSIFGSAHAMDFDYSALRRNNTVIYSDISPLDGPEDMETDTVPAGHKLSPLRYEEDDVQELAKTVLQVDDNMEEMHKIGFLSSHVIDSVKAGGSVLIPVSQLGIVLQLIEQISSSLDVLEVKVLIYIISSVGQELLALTNTISEWLCKQRQEKLFSGHPIFGHVKLMNEGKLHVFPAIHSPKLLMNWQEPCIVFTSHWSLRLGPAVHLLRRWCGDPNSLLILENELVAELALLPFRPVAMKVIQCSFLSGIRLLKVQPLLSILQLKVLLFPKDLKLITTANSTAFSVFRYCPGETLCIPSLNDRSEFAIATDLAFHFDWRKLKQGDISMTRLKGALFIERGKQRLISGMVQESSEIRRPLVHRGSPDLGRLLTVLSSHGIKGTLLNAIGDESENATTILVSDPSQALIEVKETSTVITATCDSFASFVFELVGIVLDGI